MDENGGSQKPLPNKPKTELELPKEMTNRNRVEYVKHNPICHDHCQII